MSASDVPVFVISRRFDAPIGSVYEAWADPVQMAAWSGPAGSTVTILRGEMKEGETTVSRTSSAEMGDMYSLNKWVEFSPPTRVAWEQSFCDVDGNKCLPSFFENWPMTLLTEVDLKEADGGTDVTLHWTPIEYTPEGLAEFEKQMASMTGGWTGSLDKLEEYLAGHA